ncbi:tomoregulin-1-like protein [Lates japonicus]|uniref:Tomoregulin-1-like protein n=1 Tax=Lates japonicus TaxID=270547 RepID=A0AAD3MVZ7_LATJO|nr:tomoregulin-1-like protein [Lates japonicus]
MAPECRSSCFCSLLVLLVLPAVRSSFPRSGGSSSADCGPGKAADCPDLSEKKSDLRVCDAGTCRFGGTCRENGADIKCVCQFHCHKKCDPVCVGQAGTVPERVFLGRAAYDEGSVVSKGLEMWKLQVWAECDEDSEDMLCMCNIVLAAYKATRLSWPAAGVTSTRPATSGVVSQATQMDKSRKDDGIKTKPDIYGVKRCGGCCCDLLWTSNILYVVPSGPRSCTLSPHRRHHWSTSRSPSSWRGHVLHQTGYLLLCGWRVLPVVSMGKCNKPGVSETSSTSVTSTSRRLRMM